MYVVETVLVELLTYVGRMIEIVHFDVEAFNFVGSCFFVRLLFGVRVLFRQEVVEFFGWCGRVKRINRVHLSRVGFELVARFFELLSVLFNTVLNFSLVPL